MFLGLLGEISDDAFLAPGLFGGPDDRVLEQPVGLLEMPVRPGPGSDARHGCG
jgi:hypothetical protein